MSNPKQFEEALERLAGSLKDVFRELRAAIPDAASIGAAMPAAAAPPPPPPPPPPPAPVGPGTDLLHQGFEKILAAANQSDIMQALLDGAEGYASRSAVLVVKGDRLAPWRWRGFGDDVQNAIRSLNVNSDGPSGWKQAAASTAEIPDSAASSFFGPLGRSKDGKAYLIPLLVRDRAVAMLYGDSGSDGLLEQGALRLLVRTAGMKLEMMSGGPAKPAAAPAAAPAPPPPPAPAPPPPTATQAINALGPTGRQVAATPAPPAAAAPPPPPAPAPAAPPPPAAPPVRKVAGPDLTNIPAADQEIHKKAFRFAKLLVDELMLYNKDKVAQGKQARNVYSLLHEDIDKSRLAYEKKFANTPAARVDYFHQQMVAQIGDGDPAAIGSGYPGPLV